MRRQNMREQNKFHDVVATVETKEKELERCHLLDRKDHQHVLVDPQKHISQLLYVNISVHSLYRQSADHRLILGSCANRNGRQCWYLVK